MHIVMSLIGMLVLLGIAFALSSNRRAIRVRVVLSAFALQAALAAFALYVPWGKQVLLAASSGVITLLGYGNEGIALLLGPLATHELGRSLALQSLPIIIFFAALISVLYHLGIMQYVIRWIGGGLQKITGISKVESLCAAANIFVGQSESPLVIRPYLSSLVPSQLFCVMTVGLAGTAGTILAIYAAQGVRIDYLLAAAFMSAPGAILMAKIIMPDDLPNGLPNPIQDDPAMAMDMHEEEKPANIIMAASQGAQTGVRLAVAVAAMILAFVALVALANGILGGIGGLLGFEGVTFQGLLGYVFAPIMYLLGVPWHEAMSAGGLFGTKVVLNEVVGFIELGKMKNLSEPTVAIVTFALCGFANILSIAIQMAVTGGLAPNQRPMIAKLGMKALAAGSLANLMSAALAGLFLSLG